MTDAIRYTCEKCEGDSWSNGNVPSVEDHRGCHSYWLVGTEHLRLRILGVEGDAVRLQIAEQKWRGNDFNPQPGRGMGYDAPNGVRLYSMIGPLWSSYACRSFQGYLAVRGCDEFSVRDKDLDVVFVAMPDFLRLVSAVQSYCEKAAEWERQGEENKEKPEDCWLSWHAKNCPALPRSPCNGAYSWGRPESDKHYYFAGHTCREVYESKYGKPDIRCDECGAYKSATMYVAVDAYGKGTCSGCISRHAEEFAAVEAEDEKAKNTQNDSLRERHVARLWYYRNLYSVGRKMLADPATTRAAWSKLADTLEEARHEIVCLEAELSLATYDLLVKLNGGKP